MPRLDEPAPGARHALDATDKSDPGTDLRMPVLGLVAWLGGLAGVLLSPLWCAGTLLGGAALALLLRRRVDPRTLLVWLLIAVAVAGGAQLRQEQLARSPVTALASQGAAVEVVLMVTTDPKLRHGDHGDYVVLRGRVLQIQGRGRTWQVGAPVLVLGPRSWRTAGLGTTVRTAGRLAPAEDPKLAAVLSPRSAPSQLRRASPAWRATAAVRASLRASVAHLDADARVLVPSLVVGDDEGMPEDLAEEFRITGLTHLLAVSGTNLTLVVGFLLIVARGVGLRGRWLYAVGAVGIVGFVMLARTEPSVVRAAAMGTVALIGMGSNGRQRGVRALGVAVVALLLIDPWLSTTIGFGLSAAATAGILVLAPVWRDAMMSWTPRWIAEAVAVPAAAQLACTPLIAAISGQVSLVAVTANILVAPAVAPATIIGLAAGFVGLGWPSAATVLGSLAGWCVWWIIAVAGRGAAAPTGALDWDAGVGSIAGLTLLCLAVALAAGPLLARRRTGPATVVVVLIAAVVPVPSPGWPPHDWSLAVCDVGQGDGLVLRGGDGRGVVVDTGVDPRPIGNCLHRLGVREVPLLVLTHFDADHVGGLAGVLQGRRVGEIWVSELAEPAPGAAAVQRAAAAARVPVRVPGYGETARIDGLTLQVLAPSPGSLRRASVEPRPNDASLVILAAVRGVRVLLTGDIEPGTQRDLARELPGLRVDVLKVPHHGSRHQDLDFLLGLQPRVGLVSVGAANRYGHPAAQVLAPLEAAGVEILRTDQDGEVVLRIQDGRIGVAARK